jgi:hypothetical protein
MRLTLLGLLAQMKTAEDAEGAKEIEVDAFESSQARDSWMLCFPRLLSALGGSRLISLLLRSGSGR